MNDSRLDKYVLAGELALKRQNTDGSMPKGKNGPHNHNMTSARNTGHFAIFFLYLYKVTSDEKWKIAGKKSLEHLLTLRPLGGSFWHRKEKLKTSYNGLIGQAWSLESLIYGYSILNEEKYLESAKELINLHEFNEKEFLWHEVDLDGTTRPCCMTLNQQIWFTAMVSKAYHEDSKMKMACEKFLTSIGEHMRIRREGLLSTLAYKKSVPLTHRIIKLIWDKYALGNRREIDIGYHLFTVTGLALLYEQFPDHPFYESKKFETILNYCFSNKYWNELSTYPRYGFEYNVIGFELPYVYSVFQSHLNNQAKLIAIQSYSKQREFYSSISEGLLACNSFDTDTLAARIYEVYRIDESFFELII